MPDALSFVVLGPLSVHRDGREIPLPARHLRWLLGILLLHEGELVSDNHLLTHAWKPGQSSPGALHTAVSRLRSWLRSLDVDLTHEDGGYRLRVPPDSVDARRFVAQQDDISEDLDGPAQLLRLRAALDEWGDGALAGAPEWVLVDPAVARLNAVRRHCVRRLGAVALDTASPDEALPYLAHLCDEQEHDEPLHAAYLRLLAAAGRPAEALLVYERLRQRLAEELGVAPSEEVQRAHQAILAEDRELTPPRDRVEPARTVPAQLPADVPGFVGRELDSALLHSFRADGAQHSPVAIVGTAGVGKTALAVHWAHQIRADFPDGQLYVNLRGFAPGQSSMSVGEALRGFLDAFAVAPQQIPASLDAQMGLYRSLLAGKRVLVVLDNARDPDQVRPLLPGSPDCLVVLTSRNQMAGLVATDGAHPVALDLLSPAEAGQLLSRRLGRDRVAAEPEAVRNLIVLCAQLPLALAIVAARAAIQPRLALAELADELRRSRGLAAFSGDDQATNVRAVFSWSTQAVRPAAARLFRLLGLHPGPDIAAAAAASLAAIPVPRARALLTELVRAHLLIEQIPGRYSLHDLLHAYAVEQVHALEPATARESGTRRMLDHYLHSAYRASVLFEPFRDPISLAEPTAGVTPEDQCDADAAMAWYVAEYPVMLAVIDVAANDAYDTHTWQLVWGLIRYLQRRGLANDLLKTLSLAQDATRRLGLRSAEAWATQTTASTFAQLGRYEDAQAYMDIALRLHIEDDNQMGQAHLHYNMARVYDWQDHHEDTLHHAEQALKLYRTCGNRAGEAHAVNASGWAHIQLGNYEFGLTHCEEALRLFQELGDRNGAAGTWDSIGHAHHHLGHHRESVDCYRHAERLYREIGDRYNEADVLSHVGEAHLSVGECDEARRAWQQALLIFVDLGHPDEDKVRARLRDIDSHVAGTVVDQVVGRKP